MFTISSNISEISAHITEQLAQLTPGSDAFDSALLQATTAQLQSMTARIHEQGLATDGSPIGQYSTKPMYVSGGGTGKRGQSSFRSGKPHRSQYYATGYKDYRQQRGLPSDTVVLRLSGELMQALTVTKTTKGYGISWNDSSMSTRAAQLEAHYGKTIWQATDTERQTFTTSLRNSLRTLIR